MSAFAGEDFYFNIIACVLELTVKDNKFLLDIFY